MLTNLPNPSCCRSDNLAHLCESCRAEYVKANPVLPAYRFANTPITDPSDILPLPVMNFAEDTKPGNHRHESELLYDGPTIAGDDAPLVAPRINWSWRG